MSPELSEALRKEIQTALDAGGGPFDVNVARRVYDLAIAARDMCVAATASVKEAVDQVKDTCGPMESLDTADTPESQVQASESFGARLLRELMASLTLFQQPRGGDDPKQLVHALAEARRTGMHDVAEQIEVKLFGRVLSGPRPVVAEEVEDGAANSNFDLGFADGRAGVFPMSQAGAYHEGYLKGTTARYLDEGSVVVEGRGDVTWSVFAVHAGQPETHEGMVVAATYEEALVRAREMFGDDVCHIAIAPATLVKRGEGRSGRKHPRPPSGMENAFDQWAEQNACKVCGNRPDDEGTIAHGRGCYVACEDGGGTTSVDLPAANGASP